MPIAIDSSSPALVTGNKVSAITTPAVSPPAGSLLLATTWWSAGGSGTALSSTGGLTWTQRGSSRTLFTAPCPTALTGITVSLTGTSLVGGLKVFVLTGADLDNPVGAIGTGGPVSTNNATLNAYTSTTAGSRGFCAAGDGNARGAPATTDMGYPFHVAASPAALSAILLTKAANTGAAGTAVTFNADAAGTLAAAWYWDALEILPAPDVVPFQGWGIPIK